VLILAHLSLDHYTSQTHVQLLILHQPASVAARCMLASPLQDQLLPERRASIKHAVYTPPLTARAATYVGNILLLPLPRTNWSQKGKQGHISTLSHTLSPHGLSALETTLLPKRLQQCSLLIILFNATIFILQYVSLCDAKG
jgi:hypothetical protein